jgi:3-phosphoinositide dependent protein kinase-1
MNNNLDNNNLDNEDKEINKKRSSTFVGTAEYVSPEILSDNPPSFGTDIWALGCIIYKMYYNKTPFVDKTEYLIFKNIEKNEINFDDNILIPDDAKDIIKKLLIKDPFLRLGGGSNGSEYDINSLKKHPFFNNINFDNIINENPPFENEFNFSYLNNNDNNENNKEKENNVEILKEGILEKKSPWLHYNKRKVILYSTPKINYIDPKQMK